MVWHHPNVYKKIRAERKKIPVSGTPNRETGSAENLNAENSERFVSQAHKRSSTEAQASKPQAKGSSLKPKSTSSKIR